MAPIESHNRRSSDSVSNKLAKYGGLIILLTTILVTAGSLVWAKKDDVNARCNVMDTRMNASEKDIVEIKTDIKYIIKMMEQGHYSCIDK